MKTQQTNRKLKITITRQVHDLYSMSIRRRAPETYALLAGRLEDPFHVTDFRPMPPMLSPNGEPNASTTHVQLNAPFAAHYLNNELIPAEKYLIGCWHSHPRGATQLSRGRPGSGDGDVASMKGTLERAAALGRPWKYFLAPLTTFAPDWTDTITGWVVTLDDPDPIPADVVIVDGTGDTVNDVVRNVNYAVAGADGSAGFPIDEWLACANVYQEHINRFAADRISPDEDKKWMAEFWRELRRDDLVVKKQAFLSRLKLTT